MNHSRFSPPSVNSGRSRVPAAKSRLARAEPTPKRLIVLRWAVGPLAIALAAILGWTLLSARHESIRPVVSETAGTATAPRTSPVVVTSRVPPPHVAKAPPPPANLAILRDASREELLAYSRDLLAKGGPLENVVALLEYLVDYRPELAVDLAREIGRTDGERQVLLYASLSAWAGKDASGALRWAFRNSSAYDLRGQASLVYIALEQIAADDPAAAVAATETSLRSETEGRSVKPAQDVARFTLEALIKTGHSHLAQQAIEQWTRGPEGARLNPSDFEVVVMAIARDSYSDAGTWLVSLRSSSARNQAYLPFALAWSREDATAAMEWAQRLNSADGGDDVRVAAFASWLKSDRAAAIEWLRAHNTPDPKRLQFLVDH